MSSIQSFLQSPNRFLFFTGKGGVGKTSLACAVSVALADSGKKVLLVSTDPASNLGEVLETSLGAEPRPINGVPNLSALNIDPQEAASAYRERIVGPIRGMLPDEAVASIEEQLSGACTTEIASFNEFSRLIGDPEAVESYEHVVLDTAPTGHTLRLLNLPAAWDDFIATNTTGSSCLGPLSGLKDQRENYAGAVETLTDGNLTSLVLVARGDVASLAEAARASRELRDQGLHNQTLVINALFKASAPDDALASALEASEAQALASLPESLKDLPVIEIPFRPTGTNGIQHLRGLLIDAPPDAVGPRAGEAVPSVALASLNELVEPLAEKGRGVLMTMGKGGVGKTSIAVAIARQLADAGAPVLLATTDPADHVSGQFETLPPNLEVKAIDPKAETEAHVARVLQEAGTDLDRDARALLEEELRSPCIEEIAVFSAFAEVIAQGEERVVVVDTAPTGHTLLLLDTTEAYHREVARNANKLSEAVVALLPRLRDPEFTKILIVTLPEATPVHEAAFLQEDLRRAGMEPYAWIINRSLNESGSVDPLLVAKRSAEVPFLLEVSDQLAQRTALIPFAGIGGM